MPRAWVWTELTLSGMLLAACTGEEPFARPDAAEAEPVMDAFVGLSDAVAPQDADAEAPASCADLRDISADWFYQGACTQPGETCGIGQECCCGECFPSVQCECGAQGWECGITEACYGVVCSADAAID